MQDKNSNMKCCCLYIPLLVLVFIFLTLPIFTIPMFNQGVSQRDALLTFANQTGGSDWIHTWNLDEEDCCEWFGVTCFQDEVTRLDLAGNGLVGQIGDTLTSLSALKQLYLQDNQLYGEIDQQLFKHLLVLDLSKNDFSGLVPELTIDELTLTYVDLSFNQFYGKLDMMAPTIQFLNLLGNDISGIDLEWCDGTSKKPCLNYNSMFPYNGYICPSINLGHYNMILVEPETFGGYSKCNTCSIC